MPPRVVPKGNLFHDTVDSPTTTPRDTLRRVWEALQNYLSKQESRSDLAQLMRNMPRSIFIYNYANGAYVAHCARTHCLFKPIGKN